MYAKANIRKWSAKIFTVQILTIFLLLFWKIDTSFWPWLTCNRLLFSIYLFNFYRTHRSIFLDNLHFFFFLSFQVEGIHFLSDWRIMLSFTLRMRQVQNCRSDNNFIANICNQHSAFSQNFAKATLQLLHI